MVHAMTIVSDALDIMGHAGSPQPQKPAVGPMGAAVEPGAPPLPNAVAASLQPYLGSLIVTPKEVDVLSEELAEVVAGGINLALHPAIDEDEIYQYLQ